MLSPRRARLSAPLQVLDASLDPEEHPEGFRFEGGGAKPQGATSEGDDIEATLATGETASKRRRIDDADDCVMIE